MDKGDILKAEAVGLGLCEKWRDEWQPGLDDGMLVEKFKDFLKSYENLFKHQTEVLSRFERDENLLTIPFCISYEQLLEDRLRFCRTCSEYYRTMAEKSFWFMKPLVLRRAMKFEGIHYQTLGRLMQVRLYRKLRYGEGKGYTD